MDPTPSEETAPPTPVTTEAPPVTEAAQKPSTEPKKVEVMLQPVGDAPILKKEKFAVSATNNITWLTATIRKLLNLPSEKSLFFYISHTFAPSPDHTFETLSKCYAVTAPRTSSSCSTAQLRLGDNDKKFSSSVHLILTRAFLSVLYSWI